MKKLLLLLFLSGFISMSFAQSIHLGIRAGLNESRLSEINFLNNGTAVKDNSSYISRFHAGLFAEIPAGRFSIEPGVFYSQKGAENKYQATTASSSQNYYQKTTLNYLEIPVNILYNIPVSVGKIFVGGGPYAAFGLSGHYLSTYYVSAGQNTQSGEIQGDVQFGKNDYKNPDYGINALLGLRFKNNISFNVGYGFGFTNLYRSGATAKNKVLSISVGYEFL
jgi:hypothetical protein